MFQLFLLPMGRAMLRNSADVSCTKNFFFCTGKANKLNRCFMVEHRLSFLALPREKK